LTILYGVRAWITRLAGWLAALSLLLLLVLTLAQILARNLLDTGFAGADSLARYLVLYVAFFGAAVAVERGRHIRIDVATAWLSAGTLRRLHRPLQAVAALICALLADAAIRFWRDEWTYAANYERWQVWLALMIPTGFVLLTLQYLLGAILGPDDD
jgi:TRAP-type C4-dicarboxylate transport system permease small subunit